MDWNATINVSNFHFKTFIKKWISNLIYTSKCDSKSSCHFSMCNQYLQTLFLLCNITNEKSAVYTSRSAQDVFRCHLNHFECHQILHKKRTMNAYWSVSSMNVDRAHASLDDTTIGHLPASSQPKNLHCCSK